MGEGRSPRTPWVGVSSNTDTHPTMLRPAATALLALSLPLAAQSGSPAAYEIDVLVPSLAPFNLGFGASVQTDGLRAIAGALRNPPTQASIGRAWILDQAIGGGWEVGAELDPGFSTDGSDYARAVAIQGDIALVGAPFAGTGGAVHSFVKNTLDDSWKFSQTIVPMQTQAFDRFGWSISIDNDQVLVGAPGRRTSPVGGATGAGILLQIESDGVLKEIAVLEQQVGSAVEAAGRSVSLQGDLAALGAPDGNSNFTGGAALVFSRDDNDKWSKGTTLLPGDSAPNDDFGASIGLDGKQLLVGAPLTDSLAINEGTVYVFERTTEDEWSETGSLSSPVPSTSGQFGTALDVDREVVVIGEPGSAGLPGQPIPGGAAHAFRLDGDQYEPIGYYTGEANEFGDSAARAVALSRGYVFVGISGSDQPMINSGAVGVWYEFGATDQPGPNSFGNGTPGCDGTLTLSTNLPPFVGWSDVEVRCDNAPPLSAGLLYIGDQSSLGGSDPFGLGIALHLDPLSSSFLIPFSMSSDASGDAATPLPIPANPALAGVGLTLQAVWSGASCSASPFGLATSRGFRVTVGEG